MSIIMQRIGGCGCAEGLVVEELLAACRLEIGKRCRSNPAYATDLGLSIDEEGNVRTDGFVVIRDGVNGLVLRNAVSGDYFSLTVSAGGELVITNIGASEP